MDVAPLKHAKSPLKGLLVGWLLQIIPLNADRRFHQKPGFLPATAVDNNSG
jgi:hypothetical protein